MIQIVSSTKDIEDRYMCLKKYIVEAVLEATGKKLRVEEDGSVIGGYEKKVKRKWKKNPVKWWDKECEEIVEQRKTALHNYMKDKTRKNWIEYKRSRAVARKTIKKKKREDFQEFAESQQK